MRSIDRTETLRRYAAPRCHMTEIRAGRGLCLSNGADHGGFSEKFYPDWQN